jgi:putative transposase
MRNPLKRYYGDGDLHFVTFSCYRRRAYLGPPRARDELVKILNLVRCRFGFRLIGYVVMPEHVHLLLSESQPANPSKILQTLKQNMSRTMTLKSSSTELAARSAPFWQRRFHDFNVWSAAKVREKLKYMHHNPVERGLVQSPKDWPWSSWSYYELGEPGLIAIDAVEEKQSQKPHP